MTREMIYLGPSIESITVLLTYIIMHKKWPFTPFRNLEICDIDILYQAVLHWLFFSPCFCSDCFCKFFRKIDFLVMTWRLQYRRYFYSGPLWPTGRLFLQNHCSADWCPPCARCRCIFPFSIVSVNFRRQWYEARWCSFHWELSLHFSFIRRARHLHLHHFATFALDFFGLFAVITMTFRPLLTFLPFFVDFHSFRLHSVQIRAIIQCVVSFQCCAHR